MEGCVVLICILYKQSRLQRKWEARSWTCEGSRADKGVTGTWPEACGVITGINWKCKRGLWILAWLPQCSKAVWQLFRTVREGTQWNSKGKWVDFMLASYVSMVQGKIYDCVFERPLRERWRSWVKEDMYKDIFLKVWNDLKITHSNLNLIKFMSLLCVHVQGSFLQSRGFTLRSSGFVPVGSSLKP